MVSDHDELFGVFLRDGNGHGNGTSMNPEGAEYPLATCYSYQEAKEIQRLFQRTSQECVIRLLGTAGGGD